MSTWIMKSLDRLSNQLIDHPNYVLAESRLFSGMQTRVGGECLVFTGPSRAGKTTIAANIHRLINGGSDLGMASRHQPCVKLSLANTGPQGALTTKQFYLSALRAIRHPFFSMSQEDSLPSIDRIRRMHATPNDVLAEALESALRCLQVRYLIIDEAQHIQYALGGSRAACQILEMLKTLSERLGCTLVLAGAYPVLNVVAMAPHLLGRSFVVELPRYQVDDAQDIGAFDGVLAWISEHIRFQKKGLSLRTWSEFLYEGSLGTVGLLTVWLRNALSDVMTLGDTVLRRKHLEMAQLPAEQLRELRAEIDNGEAYIAADPAIRKAINKSGITKPDGKPFTPTARRHEKGGRS